MHVLFFTTNFNLRKCNPINIRSYYGYILLDKLIAISRSRERWPTAKVARCLLVLHLVLKRQGMIITTPCKQKYNVQWINRFDISAVHPQRKLPGTYTEVPYCRVATAREVYIYIYDEVITTYIHSIDST